MRENFKEPDTGLKVLEILKYLSKQDASYYDLELLLRNFSRKETSDETILKYINTLKFAGLDIIKTGDKGVFRLENHPFTIDLTEQELKTISQLEAYSKSFGNEKLKKDFNLFLNNLSKYFSSDLKEKYKKMQEKSNAKPQYHYPIDENKLREFEKYCDDNQRLEIEEKRGNETNKYLFEPVNLIYDKTSVYLSGYLPDSASNKKVNIKNITTIKQLPTKSSGNKYLNTVVFECFGRLAKNYKLKPSEKIINSSSDSVIISNAEEDREILIRRILKYGENARLLRPESLRNKMTEILDEMIENRERELKSK